MLLTKISAPPLVSNKGEPFSFRVYVLGCICTHIYCYDLSCVLLSWLVETIPWFGLQFSESDLLPLVETSSLLGFNSPSLGDLLRRCFRVHENAILKTSVLRDYLLR